MNWQEYLKSIMTDEQIEQLREAMQLKRDFIVKGPQLPTGKSTLVQVLRALGYHAVEQQEWTHEVELSHPIRWITDGSVSCSGVDLLKDVDAIKDWVGEAPAGDR